MKHLTLERTDYLPTGVFGKLSDEDGDMKPALYTLEHAYPSDGTTSFAAKIPPGSYACRRGIHRLKNAGGVFETFEVEDVPGHSNILFHPGNTETDSEGCILLGGSRIEGSILYSRAAFRAFMTFVAGEDEFELTVI